MRFYFGTFNAVDNALQYGLQGSTVYSSCRIFTTFLTIPADFIPRIEHRWCTPCATGCYSRPGLNVQGGKDRWLTTRLSISKRLSKGAFLRDLYLLPVKLHVLPVSLPKLCSDSCSCGRHMVNYISISSSARLSKLSEESSLPGLLASAAAAKAEAVSTVIFFAVIAALVTPLLLLSSLLSIALLADLAIAPHRQRP